MRRTPGERAAPPPWLLLLVLGLSGVAVYAQQSVVLPLAPHFAAEYGVGPAASSWIITSTVLLGATSSPVLARLGDIHGTRNVLLVSLACALVGAVLCATTHSLPVLLAGRVIAGGALAAQPISLSILKEKLPPEQVAAGVATIGGTSAIGIAVGPILAGIVSSVQGTFWMLAAICAVSLALALVFVPATRRQVGARVDYLGAVLLTVMVLLALLPVSMGNEWGWVSAPVLASLVAAVAVAAVWAHVERRVLEPFIDLQVNTRGPVMRLHLAGGAAGFTMFGNSIVTSIMIQAPEETGYGHGLDLSDVGLVFLAGAAGMALAAPLAARLLARIGVRLTLIVGTAVMAAGYVLRLVLHPWLTGVIVSFAGIFAGISIAVASLAVLALGAAPPERVTEVLGTQQVVRLAGQAASSSAIGLVSSWLVVDVAGTSYPSWSAIVVCSVGGAISAMACLCLVIFATSPQPRRVAARDLADLGTADVAVLHETPRPGPLKEADDGKSRGHSRARDRSGQGAGSLPRTDAGP